MNEPADWAELAAGLPCAASFEAVVAGRPARLAPSQLVELIVAAEKLISHVQALQLTAVAEFAQPGRCGDLSDLIEMLTEKGGQAKLPDGTIDVDALDVLIREQAQRMASAEIAAALCQSPRGASRRVSDALEMVDHLPATLSALRDGRIDRARAAVIADRTHLLADELRGGRGGRRGRAGDHSHAGAVQADDRPPGHRRRSGRRAEANGGSSGRTMCGPRGGRGRNGSDQGHPAGRRSCQRLRTAGFDCPRHRWSGWPPHWRPPRRRVDRHLRLAAHRRPRRRDPDEGHPRSRNPNAAVQATAVASRRSASPNRNRPPTWPTPHRLQAPAISHPPPGRSHCPTTNPNPPPTWPTPKYLPSLPAAQQVLICRSAFRSLA